MWLYHQLFTIQWTVLCTQQCVPAFECGSVVSEKYIDIHTDLAVSIRYSGLSGMCYVHSNINNVAVYKLLPAFSSIFFWSLGM